MNTWKKIGLYAVCCILTAAAIFEVVIWHPARQARVPVQKLILALWRGDSSEAMWLDHRDSSTEMILHPSPKASPSMGYYMRANAHIHLGKKQYALQDIKAGNVVHPAGQRHSSLHSTIEGFAELGHYKEATEMWEKLIQKFPDEEGNYFVYATFLARTKNGTLRDTPRAVKLVKKGLALVKSPTRYDHEFLAIILASNGEFDEAIKECDEALKLPAATPENEARSTAEIKKYREQFSKKQKPNLLSF